MIRRWVFILPLLSACSSLPQSSFKPYVFPTGQAFIGDVSRPYVTLGQVRGKVNFNSLDEAHDETELCSNYFNKAVLDMVQLAGKRGADAVIGVQSVVFYHNGQQDRYSKPECSDDGIEGQVLTEGVAVRWKN